MIPKIIHYVWLGQNSLPEEMQECIDSWKRFMPDYEIKKWDNQVIDKLDIHFVKQAVREKKWAFASDVIRLWAVYQFGGIYLDTDVMVYKSFDDLLDNHAFIGRECCLQIMGSQTEFHLTSFCFGAEPKSEYIKRCLLYYNGRPFIHSTESSLPPYLRYDLRNASYIHSEIAKTFGYDPSALANPEQKCRDNYLKIYPYTFFADNIVSDKTYCHHLSYGSWRGNDIKHERITLRYKIKWRAIKLLEKILKRFNYTLVEIK